MNRREPLDKTDYLIVFSFLLGLNLVTGRRDLSRSVCHVKCVNLLCIDSIGFPHQFDIIGSSLRTQFNKVYLET